MCRAPEARPASCTRALAAQCASSERPVNSFKASCTRYVGRSRIETTKKSQVDGVAPLAPSVSGEFRDAERVYWMDRLEHTQRRLNALGSVPTIRSATALPRRVCRPPCSGGPRHPTRCNSGSSAGIFISAPLSPHSCVRKPQTPISLFGRVAVHAQPLLDQSA